MPIIETLYGALFRGPKYVPIDSKSNQFAGRTSMGSASATVTVSSTVIGSDSMIRLAMQATVRANSGMGIEVSTISPGNFFTITTGNGTAFSPARETTIMWEIVKGSD